MRSDVLQKTYCINESKHFCLVWVKWKETLLQSDGFKLLVAELKIHNILLENRERRSKRNINIILPGQRSKSKCNPNCLPNNWNHYAQHGRTITGMYKLYHTAWEQLCDSGLGCILFFKCTALTLYVQRVEAVSEKYLRTCCS